MTDADRIVREDFSQQRGVLPSHLPRGWGTAGFVERCGWAFRHKDGLYVLMTTNEERDDCMWMHVSFSRQDKVPDWSDTARVKHAFIGDNRKAIVVLPPASEYVNIHPRVLHLWCNLDKDPLPDFRWGDGGI